MFRGCIFSSVLILLFLMLFFSLNSSEFYWPWCNIRFCACTKVISPSQQVTIELSIQSTPAEYFFLLLFWVGVMGAYASIGVPPPLTETDPRDSIKSPQRLESISFIKNSPKVSQSCPAPGGEGLERAFYENFWRNSWFCRCDWSLQPTAKLCRM